MATALALTDTTAVTAVCMALGLARSGYYRWRFQPLPVPRPAPPRALPQDECRAVLAVLGSQRFADQAAASSGRPSERAGWRHTAFQKS